MPIKHWMVYHIVTGEKPGNPGMMHRLFTVQAAGEHTCSLCGATIRKGETYGNRPRMYVCAKCIEKHGVKHGRA